MKRGMQRRSQKKAIKTVAKVAAVGALAYGGYALATGAGFGGGGGLLSTAWGKGTQTLGMKLSAGLGAIKGILSSPIASVAGLGFNVYSQLQARKFAGEQSAYAKQASLIEQAREETASRYAMAQARLQRLASIREQRIKTGQVTAEAGGAGIGTAGTSSFTGAVGTLATQAAANIGKINQAEGFAQDMSGYNQQLANISSKSYTAGVKSEGWTSTSSLIGGMGYNFKNIFDIKPIA